jgi:hypothetical protein
MAIIQGVSGQHMHEANMRYGSDELDGRSVSSLLPEFTLSEKKTHIVFKN